MRISDWSSDVCSSDLLRHGEGARRGHAGGGRRLGLSRARRAYRRGRARDRRERGASAALYGGGMTQPVDPRIARNRYFAMTATRIAGAAGAVFGVVLIARAQGWPDKAIGVGIVLAALYMIATVPRALAHRWRSDADQ